MKHMDERGRLFGRINLVDLLAVLLILGILAAAAVKVLGNTAAANPLNRSISITYTVRVNNIDPAVAEELDQYVSAAEGRRDQLMAAGQMLNGYITDYTATPQVNYSWNSEGAAVISAEEDPGARVSVLFTIEAEVQNPYVNELGTQEIRIGKAHIVKTANFEFLNGTIYDCIWHGEEGAQ